MSLPTGNGPEPTNGDSGIGPCNMRWNFSFPAAGKLWQRREPPGKLRRRMTAAIFYSPCSPSTKCTTPQSYCAQMPCLASSPERFLSATNTPSSKWPSSITISSIL